MDINTILKNQHGKNQFDAKLMGHCPSKYIFIISPRKTSNYKNVCHKWEERKRHFRNMGISQSGIYVSEERLKKMDEKLDLLLERESPFDERIVVIRTIDREQAKVEILELFKKEGRLFDSDVATKLRLDLGVVIDIIDELEEEGSIGDIEDE